MIGIDNITIPNVKNNNPMYWCRIEVKVSFRFLV